MRADSPEASDSLRASEARYQSILETSLDGILVMDEHGNIVEWNPAAERIFGWSRAEVLGQPLAEHIIPERMRAAHYRGLAHYLASGEGPVLRRRLELPAVRRDGAEFPVELSISPLPEQVPRLFVGFIRDISERKQTEDTLREAKEAAEVASRAKDNFLAALSHELRTPLAPVLMTAAALRNDQSLPAEIREQLGMMERNIGLEARLIDDLLDLTRISRGKLRLREEWCDLHSLIGLAVEIVRNEVRLKSIELTLDLQAQHAGLRGDPARLQQVFWNLLRNAIKFTPEGGWIAIRTSDDLAHGSFRATIADSGIGLAPDAAERIFSPFEQAGRENDHRFGGLGLGLTIARAIIDLHGGKIAAESAGEGAGATFSIELPQAGEAPHGVVHRDGTASPSDTPALCPLRLLLVEDHEATLQVLARLLTRSGHHVLQARTVREALAVASGNEIDGVVSDVGLPDGTGLELMATLRQDRPALRGIALSGYGMEEDLQRSEQAGFLTHLVKPVVYDDLDRALRALASAGEGMGRVGFEPTKA